MENNVSQLSSDDSVADDIDYFGHTPISQAIRPQQFYHDLDQALDNQPKDLYIPELIRICKDDPESINDYRERLAERAKQDPSCPKTKLLNRRNSPNSTKSQKLANDCYVLYMFTKGNSSRDIFDVFTTCATGTYDASANVTLHAVIDPSQNDATSTSTSTQSKSGTRIEIPDITTMLLNLQSDLAAMSNIVKHNNAILLDIGNETRTLTTNTKLILASVNGLRSKFGDTAKLDQISDDMKNISANIGRINKKIENTIVNNEAVAKITETPIQRLHTKDTHKTPDLNYAKAVNNEIVSPDVQIVGETRLQTNANTDKNVNDKAHGSLIAKVDKVVKSTNKGKPDEKVEKNPSIHIHLQTERKQRNKIQERKDTLSRSDIRTAAADKFKAVRKRRIVSFYIGNIDPDVSDNDIYQYMTENDVKCTFIKMFYGKSGSAARINIPDEFTEKVEDREFWPVGISIRKWQRKTEWDKENSYRNKSRYPYESTGTQFRRKRNDNYDSDFKRDNEKSYECDYDRDGDYYHKDDYYDHKDSGNDNKAWATDDHDDWNVQAENEWGDGSSRY